MPKSEKKSGGSEKPPRYKPGMVFWLLIVCMSGLGLFLFLAPISSVLPPYLQVVAGDFVIHVVSIDGSPVPNAQFSVIVTDCEVDRSPELLHLRHGIVGPYFARNSSNSAPFDPSGKLKLYLEQPFFMYLEDKEGWSGEPGDVERFVLGSHSCVQWRFEAEGFKPVVLSPLRALIGLRNPKIAHESVNAHKLRDESGKLLGTRLDVTLEPLQ